METLDVVDNMFNNIPRITEIAPFPFQLALLHLRLISDSLINV